MLGPSPQSYIRGAGPGRRASRERRQTSGDRWPGPGGPASASSHTPQRAQRRRLGRLPELKLPGAAKPSGRHKVRPGGLSEQDSPRGQRGGGGASCQTTSSAGSPPCVTLRAGAEGRRGAVSSGDGLRGGPPNTPHQKGHTRWKLPPPPAREHSFRRQVSTRSSPFLLC